MYKVIKGRMADKKINGKKRDGKILNLAIIMFISFSLLNVFLIFSFISILNNIVII